MRELRYNADLSMTRTDDVASARRFCRHELGDVRFPFGRDPALSFLAVVLFVWRHGDACKAVLVPRSP